MIIWSVRPVNYEHLPVTRENGLSPDGNFDLSITKHIMYNHIFLLQQDGKETIKYGE